MKTELLEITMTCSGSNQCVIVHRARVDGKRDIIMPGKRRSEFAENLMQKRR